LQQKLDLYFAVFIFCTVKSPKGNKYSQKIGRWHQLTERGISLQNIYKMPVTFHNVHNSADFCLIPRFDFSVNTYYL